MFKFSVDNIDIKINLEPGLYWLGVNSSTGKSFLCDLLKTHRTYGGLVAGYTYNDVLMGYKFSDMINVNGVQAKVILVDRYDMYLGTLDDEMREAAKKSVVLYDSKLNGHLGDKIAIVNLSDNLIEVIET